MSRLRVVPIVEGQGEVVAVRTLLQRIWHEVLGGEFIDVLRPIRRPRSKLIKMSSGTPGSTPDAEEIGRAVKLATAKLRSTQPASAKSLILIVLDANSDCPATLAPRIAKAAGRAASGVTVAVVLAKVEYETWFVAGADSLHEHLNLKSEEPPADPESQGCGKAWVEKHFLGSRYSETVDQVKLTARLDLGQCRRRSPSFDKLCRELEAQLEPG